MHLTIRNKLRLGFLVIILLAFFLGHLGFIGVIRIKYAVRYQTNLAEMLSMISRIAYLEERVLSGNYEDINTVERYISKLLKFTEKLEEDKSLWNKIIYIAALAPKREDNTALLNYVGEFVTKVITLNQKIRERINMVNSVKFKFAELNILMKQKNLHEEAAQLEILLHEATTSFEPVIINRILDKLYALKKQQKSLALTVTSYEEFLKKLKEIDIVIIDLKESMKNLEDTILRETKEGISKAKSSVQNAIIFTMGSTALIFFIAILFAGVVSHSIIKDITKPLNKIILAIKRAKEGDFSQEIPYIKREDELGELATWFNELLSTLRENVGFIIEKSVETVTSRITPLKTEFFEGNPIVKAKEIVEMLVKLNRYKSLIEGDYDKKEIYYHLMTTLKEEFGVDECIPIELNESKNRLESVFEENEGKIAIEIMLNPALCRAKRTGEIVNSADFPHICPHIKAKEDEFVLCIPVVMGGEVKGIIKIIEKREHYEALIKNLPYIIKYTETTAPVVYASKLLEITREQTYKDALTGLYNRRFLDVFLEKYIRLAKRKGFTVGFLMIDIDNFKKINDTYGHKAGDLILKGVAKTIEGSIRSSDIAIRYGGEEFLVILPEVTEGKSFDVGEKIRKTIEVCDFDVDGEKVKITVSVGAAEFPRHSDDPGVVIKYADMALYKAKKLGKNRTIMFNEDLLKEFSNEDQSI